MLVSIVVGSEHGIDRAGRDGNRFATTEGEGVVFVGEVSINLSHPVNVSPFGLCSKVFPPLMMKAGENTALKSFFFLRCQISKPFSVPNYYRLEEGRAAGFNLIAVKLDAQVANSDDGSRAAA